VVIVNATRDDLRGEIVMSDEAFALSPISARATQPSEADYDAIREAFMETSRGRWFLGEYAKRNRNADTAMVLDAVARIEDTLAAQNKPADDPALGEALAAIRAALDAARIAAAAALGDLAVAENLAPVRKGARVIREISWRLREIGADGRICDLIDSQVGAIEEASGKLATIDPATALSVAFELIEGRIAAFDAGEASDVTQKPIEEAIRPSSQATEDTYSSASAVATEQEIAASPEANLEPADAFDEQDEAVLDMIAAEMAAPDSDQAYVPPGMTLDEAEAAELAEAELIEAEPIENEPIEAEPIAVAEPAEPMAVPLQAATEAVAPSLEPSVGSSAGPSGGPSPAPSLGSSLIANGIVQRPRPTRPDPLAAIRRMSQSERIAFFS
jgi:hypothetical protein